MLSALLLVLTIFLISSHNSTAASEPKVAGVILLQPGELQRYVSFPFTIPKIEGVSVYKYKPGSRFFKTAAQWRLLTPSTNTSQYGGGLQGIYRFSNNSGKILQINGIPHEAPRFFSFLDINQVGDLGLFNRDGNLSFLGVPQTSNIWGGCFLFNTSGGVVSTQEIISQVEQLNERVYAFLVADARGIWKKFHFRDNPETEKLLFGDQAIVAVLFYNGIQWIFFCP